MEINHTGKPLVKDAHRFYFYHFEISQFNTLPLVLSTLCSKNCLAVILASVSIKKKFAYRYRLYDHNGMRKEKREKETKL